MYPGIYIEGVYQYISPLVAPRSERGMLFIEISFI